LIRNGNIGLEMESVHSLLLGIL